MHLRQSRFAFPLCCKRRPARSRADKGSVTADPCGFQPLDIIEGQHDAIPEVEVSANECHPGFMGKSSESPLAREVLAWGERDLAEVAEQRLLAILVGR